MNNAVGFGGVPVHLTPYGDADSASIAPAGPVQGAQTAGGVQAYGNAGPAFVAGAGSKVDITVAGIDLEGKGILIPDSFVVVYSKASGVHDWREIGRSEVAKQTASPQFMRRFQVDYRFELYQEIRLAAFNKGGETDDLRMHPLIGIADCVLGKVVLSGTTTLDLVNVSFADGSPGRLRVHARESDDSNAHMVRIGVSLGPGLHPRESQGQAESGARPATSRLGSVGSALKKQIPVKGSANSQGAGTGPPRGNPVINIVRSNPLSPSNPWLKVWESEPIEPGHPCEILLSASRLCEGDERRVFRITVLTGKEANRQPIASILSTLSALRNLQPEDHLTMKPRGYLTIHKVSEEKGSTFLDFFANNTLDITLTTAIDFTSSNGEPSTPGTLHYIDKASGFPNQYEASMRSIGNILSIYGVDRRIPAYGFGANLPPHWKVSHAFSITGDPQRPFCEGVDQLIDEYRKCLATVQLYGPTVFSEVIRTAAAIVARNMPRKHGGSAPVGKLSYTVLLLLTDGVLSDSDSTVREIVRASTLPMSIIIVGLGNEDYSKMAWLDASGTTGGNGTRLQDGNQYAVRDTVQFVPFAKYRGDLAALAGQVLGKLPVQVTQYVDYTRAQAGHPRR